jgi:hypothetical protein
MDDAVDAMVAPTPKEPSPFVLGLRVAAWRPILRHADKAYNGPLPPVPGLAPKREDECYWRASQALVSFWVLGRDSRSLEA